MEEDIKNLSLNDTDKTIKMSFRKLGRLPDNFDGKILEKFLNHKNKDIRLLAIKNIGKLKDISFLELSQNIYYNDPDSMVRREAVSTMGRMKNEEIIPILIDILHDDDPKIVLQAIRGLLPFKKDKNVVEALESIKKHPNEIIQEVIRIETQPIKYISDDHTFIPNFLKNIIVNADVRNVLNLIPENSIHLTFTSPPYYNARDYSIYKSYEEYLNFLTSVFLKVHKVTKEGRFFILNSSPVIIPRAGRKYSSKRYGIPFDMHNRLINMGWEFIDDIIWLKPGGCAKNRIGGFIQHRKPLAYKPNVVTEYLLVYRKKSDRLLDWNMKQYDSEITDSSKVLGDFDNTNVWKINPDNDEIHSAIFPEELCDKVIKYYSYKGDLVFDPFAGSGTFGKSALKLNRYFLLTEIQKTYFNRMKTKLCEMPLSNIKKPTFMNFEEFRGIVKNEK